MVRAKKVSKRISAARTRSRKVAAAISSPSFNTGGETAKLRDVKLSVVITHYNYTDVVGRAIASVLAQTHPRLELIIVDDASAESHYIKLKKIIADADDRRIRLIRLKENMGQFSAMLVGLKESEAEFISYLDPDDYLDPEFAEKMLTAHLNPRVSAPLAACEMGLYKVARGPVALSQTGFCDKMVNEGRYEEVNWSLRTFGYSHYFPPVNTGWLWAATSSLMFRRDALEFLKPTGPVEPALRRICGDGLLAYGAHMLGGTLFVHETLSWRGIHTENAVLPSRFLGSGQQFQKQVWADPVAKEFFYTNYDRLLKFAIKTLVGNGAPEYFQPSQLGEVIATHLNSKELSVLCQEDEAVRSLMWKFGSNART
jgi:glycosyltransferase involved in cell wall biosynthesis